MIMIIFCVMLFIGGLSYKIVGTVLLIAVPTVSIFLFLVLQPGQQLIHDYQVNRILAWLQPEKYADTIAYQTINSMTAIGSGQLWGKGLNNNVIASVKNGNFISEPQTDFIYAVFGEEFGFIGCVLIIGLFLAFLQRGLLVSNKCEDVFGKLLAAGITVSICLQAFINISVASSMLPATGVPMPFVSYGGTSLFITLCMVGILLNISKKRIRRIN